MAPSCSTRTRPLMRVASLWSDLYRVRRVVSKARAGLDSDARAGETSGMRTRALLVALAVSLLPLVVAAAPLQVGDQAPNFSLVDQNGQPVRLSDFRGKSNVVVAFFVMAFTPG